MALEKEIQWFDELRASLQTDGRLAWDAIRKALVDGQKPTTNKRYTQCPKCGSARICFWMCHDGIRGARKMIEQLVYGDCTSPTKIIDTINLCVRAINAAMQEESALEAIENSVRIANKKPQSKGGENMACGKNLGHGDSCVTGMECDKCLAIKSIEAMIKKYELLMMNQAIDGRKVIEDLQAIILKLHD